MFFFGNWVYIPIACFQQGWGRGILAEMRETPYGLNSTPSSDLKEDHTRSGSLSVGNLPPGHLSRPFVSQSTLVKAIVTCFVISLLLFLLGASCPCCVVVCCFQGKLCIPSGFGNKGIRHASYSVEAIEIMKPFLKPQLVEPC